jgi:hypothetical protein
VIKRILQGSYDYDPNMGVGNRILGSRDIRKRRPSTASAQARGLTVYFCEPPKGGTTDGAGCVFDGGGAGAKCAGGQGEGKREFGDGGEVEAAHGGSLGGWGVGG